MRVDVTDRKIVEGRIKRIESGKVCRLIALMGDEIIADGALEIEERDPAKHVGELRLIVSRAFQRKGLGMLMARELHFIGLQKNIKRLIVKMMRPQIGAQRIFQKLGFTEEEVIPGFAKDRTGKYQDLIIMSCDIEDMFRELEEFFLESDWGSHR